MRIEPEPQGARGEHSAFGEVGRPITNPRQRFRRLLSLDGIIVQPAVFDPFTARVAERLGFEAIALGGFAMGAHLATSEPLLSLGDVATLVSQVTLATDLPLMVDAGSGWGEPMHVMHTVRTLERAGAASLHIEDQIFPKRAHYHKGVEHVIPVEAMVAKIKAAVQARSDPDLVVVARTDAMRTDGYDEGVSRARAYAEAGADMVMLFPNDEAETRRAPKDLPGIPLIYVNSEGNRSRRGIYSARRLEDWGWRLVYDAITAINVSARAVRDAFARLKRDGETGLDQSEMIEARQFVEDVAGLDELYRIEAATVEPPGPPNTDA